MVFVIVKQEGYCDRRLKCHSNRLKLKMVLQHYFNLKEFPEGYENAIKFNEVVTNNIVIENLDVTLEECLQNEPVLIIEFKQKNLNPPPKAIIIEDPQSRVLNVPRFNGTQVQLHHNYLKEFYSRQLIDLNQFAVLADDFSNVRY